MSPIQSRIRRAALVGVATLYPSLFLACGQTAYAEEPTTVASDTSSTGIPGSTGDDNLDRLVAERLALLANQTAQLPDAPIELLQQSVAMLDLARGLRPNEIRFARASADLLMRMGERDRAIEALTAVRKIEPMDQVAMIQYIDLNTSRMETAEQKVAYLKQIIDARGIAAEVQSHAAVQLMDLYYARSQDPEAAEMLKLALQLNAQNIPALKAKYRIAAASGVAKDRVSALADLLRASPVDVDAMHALAQEADAVGDYESSGTMRLLSLSINRSRGVAPSAEDAIDFVGTQLLSNNPRAAQQVLGQLMEGLKEDGRAYSLALLFTDMYGKEMLAAAEEARKRAATQPSTAADAVKAGADAAAPATEPTPSDAAPTGDAPATPEEPIVDLAAKRLENVAMSRGVYLAQLAGVSQLLNEPDKTEMPTTLPAVPMPNVRADVAKLKAADPQGLSMAYAVALTEQLWFDMYFKAAEVDDANIAALGQLLGENDPIVVRFQGWKLLASGKVDEARLKLEAVADRDGFARLGVVYADMTAGATEKAKEGIAQLMRERPTGMIAAFIAAAAKNLEATVEPTDDELQIAKIIGSARQFVSDVVSNPRGFYLLTSQPSQVSYELGEPIVATVTLLNNGRVPVTVGPGGLIEPEFIVDTQVRSALPDGSPIGFPASARGKWTSVIRLKPQQKITQSIRIDGGELGAFLNQNFPTKLFPINAFVTSNAVKDGELSFKAGAGGQMTQMGRTIERQSAPFYNEEFCTKVLGKIANGTPSERATMAELFGIVIPPLKQQVDNAAAVAMSQTLLSALRDQIAKETNPEIRAWLQLSDRGTASESEWIMSMARSNTVLGQVGAMVAAKRSPREMRQAAATAVLASNPCPAIVEFAQALSNQPDLKQEAPPEETPPLPSAAPN